MNSKFIVKNNYFKLIISNYILTHKIFKSIEIKINVMDKTNKVIDSYIK